MKRAIPFFTLLMWALVSNGQWVEQTSGSTHWFNSVCFIDQNTGWICGNNGSDNMLVHTTDGGQNWTPQAVPVTSFIAEVTFLNTTKGWAVGNNGVLLKSVDGGDTWTQQTMPTTKALQSIWFANETNGWIVGQDGIIFHTADGGATWNPQTSGTPNRLIKVRFLNDQTGWATGWAGTILYTSNGGATWTKQTSGTTFNLNGLSIVDANNIWVVGIPGGGKEPLFDNGIILHSANAGQTWTTQLISQQWVINAVSFANLNEGWCFGSAIIYTKDGGVTWQPQVSPVTTQLTGGQFVDAFNGWAAGGDGVILHTNNSGFAVGVNDPGKKSAGIRISNEPNPFSQSTKISYSVMETSRVVITIHDVVGNIKAVLMDGESQPGEHQIGWDASSIAPGIYFCTLITGSSTKTIKMVIK